MIVPRIGTAAAMAATIVAQLVTGVLLYHFGVFDFKGAPFDLKRFLGCLFLLGGVVLVGKRSAGNRLKNPINRFRRSR